jgi:FixJ family two-component response regulator
VRKHLISVVDDDGSIRRTTTFLIESFGFRAAGFESAVDFLKSDALCGTSCLIIDVQMPGMNGLQLQSELAAAGCRIPIIFITAYDDKAYRERAMKAGAVAFLSKPFNDEELLQTIRLALHPDSKETQSLISVVDDDESTRRTTALLIESFGFRAATFESAESFLKSGVLRNTSCLILDVAMPGMNGFELQHKLAAAGYRIPTVFIVSCEEMELPGRVVQTGASAFLSKPFRDEQLLQTVRSALQLVDSGSKSAG